MTTYDSQCLKLIYDEFSNEFKFVLDDGTEMTLRNTIYWLMHRHKMARAGLARHAAIDHRTLFYIVNPNPRSGKPHKPVGPVLRVLLSLGYDVVIAAGE